MTPDDRIEYMVRHQLEARGIGDRRVLSAMRKIERHLFVAEKDDPFAYDDRPLNIGFFQTISQPYIVAYMTQVLELKGDERILEIGTGSGYQTAILAELGKEVFTIERIGALQDKAKEVLKRLNYDNIHYSHGDGSIGLLEHAPFDCIMITAAAPDIPDVLYGQLAPGGRMVVPVGGKLHQNLKLVRKTRDGRQKVESHFGCLFVPLIGEDGWKDD